MRDFRVLVFGASGLLGSNVIRFLEFNSITYFSTYSRVRSRPKDILFDASELQKLDELVLEIKPNIIINCAGIADIEFCEKDIERCQKINYAFPIALAEISSKYNIYFVNIGTDHFSTLIEQPRTETVDYITVNNYAFSKMAAEKQISHLNQNALLVRTNFFSNSPTHPRSLFNWYLNKYKSGDYFYGYSDVIFTPISSRVLVESIFHLLSGRASGVINIVGSEIISKYHFGLLILEVGELSKKLIRQGLISDNSKLVARSNYLALDNSLYIKTTKNHFPTLKEMIKLELNNSF